MEKLLRQVPLAIVAILVAAGLWYGPITQPAGYHTFADQSAYYDIPHFADVVSNIGFALVAVAGALLLRRRQRHPSNPSTPRFHIKREADQSPPPRADAQRWTHPLRRDHT